MNGWEIAGLGLVCTLVCSFWGWLAVTTVRTQTQVAKLQARMDAQEHQCEERLTWMRELSANMSEVKGNVEFIRGAMEGKAA
jgi:hypothetical protein